METTKIYSAAYTAGTAKKRLKKLVSSQDSMNEAADDL